MSLLLAVDVGNTNIVMGIYDLAQGERAPPGASWRMATSRERTVDEYGLSSLALLRHQEIDPADIGHVVISSVVPPLHPVLDAWLRDLLQGRSPVGRTGHQDRAQGAAGQPGRAGRGPHRQRRGRAWSCTARP